MTFLFSGLFYNNCLTYLGYIIIFKQTFKKQLERLYLALICVQRANFKLKLR